MIKLNINNPKAYQNKSVLMRLKDANICPSIIKNSFGSIINCKKELIVEKSVPKTKPMSKRKYILLFPFLKINTNNKKAKPSIKPTERKKLSELLMIWNVLSP